MKLIVVSLFILLTAVAIIQVLSGAAFDFNSHSQASDPDVKGMETKIAESLHNIPSVSPSGQGNGGTANHVTNEPLANSSAVNQSINATSNNASILNSSMGLHGLDGSMNKTSLTTTGGSTITDGTEVSPQEIGTSTKGVSNGFWGIQASKHVMGQSDIKSKMFLSGNFDVDKTVKFSNQGS